MQITVDISDELAARIRALGQSPESYVRGLIEDAARPAGVPKMKIADFLRAMAENSEKLPVLPDEAFTRESFYQDHD
jgi:DNA-binding ferritin-like protein